MHTKLETIVSETFAVAENTLSDDTALKDIPRWDSLAHMMLIARLEETYGVQFEGDEIADMRTVGKIRAALRAHGAPQ
jgi:acyl carrier protein